MTEPSRTDERLVFPQRKKDDPLRGSARCPGPCGEVVRFGENEDPDETLATHCAFYCPKPDHPLRWHNDSRNINRAEVPEVKANKPKTSGKPKKKGYYKKNKAKK